MPAVPRGYIASVRFGSDPQDKWHYVRTLGLPAVAGIEDARGFVTFSDAVAALHCWLNGPATNYTDRRRTDVCESVISKWVD